MAVKTKQDTKNAIYYCTFTCNKWLPLFEITNFYDHIYNWFKIIKAKGISVVAFVIMPNHSHFMIYIPEKYPSSVNNLLSNAKRFMAYEIVERLKKQNDFELLQILQDSVKPNERRKGKLHQVFESSFDAKSCTSEKFILQKLNYIHRNPVHGKWNLADDYVDYPHSSAAFYEVGMEHKEVKITHFKDVS